MRRVGRPSGYRPDAAQLAYRLCLLGLTDQQLAQCLAISTETLYAWKLSHAEFREAVTRGKAEADAQVAESLYRRATGYERQVVKVFEGTPASGPVVVRYTETLPPDIAAAKLWLVNRQPGRWRERRDVEHTLTLEERIARMTPEERLARLRELEAKMRGEVFDGEATGIED